MDFASLVAPVADDVFFRDHWEREALVVRDRPATFYRSVFSAAELESVLFFSKPKPPDIRVVAKQQDLLPDRYVTADGDLNLNQLYKVYDEGHTIIVNGLQRFCAPVAALCRHVQARLSHAVVANSYLSPAGSTALKPHYDTHDVFVLQVEGSKHWRLYGTPVESPLLGSFQPVLSREGLGPPSREVRLSAGDLMYVPRGLVHDAETTESSSLHVTIGVYPAQWLDLAVHALGALAARNARFRRALPVGWLDGTAARTEIRAAFPRILAAVAQEASVDDAFLALEDRLMRQSTPVPDGHFYEVDRVSSLDLDSELAKRDGLPCRIVTGAEEVCIQFPGNTIKGPLLYLEAMRFVADATRPFAVRALPGSLTAERKLGLAQRLVRGGLLRAV